MSTPTELWKNWEGKTVDGKFPLQKWLGGSDHSAVFVTVRAPSAQKATIKLIAAANLDADIQLSRWSETAKLAHGHLIRLFDFGRVQIDDTPVLYAVMEFADENLAEVLPVRPLTASEALDTLRPAAEELASLHQVGLVHGRIKPSNILAVQNQLKLAPDGIRKSGAPAEKANSSSYDAPEIASTGFTPASDMFSLGLTLLAVLTQKEPTAKNQAAPTVPETLSQPLRGIIQQCLQIDAAKRSTANDVLRMISPEPARPQAAAVSPPQRSVRERAAEEPHFKRGILIPVVVVVLVLLIWAGSRMFNHSSSAPAPDASSTASSSENPGNTAPPSANSAPQAGSTRGRVAQQVQPEVSPGALHTIRGHIKVSVQVTVDPSGNVSAAKLVSSGPSAYFSSRALKAAQQWKFVAPQDNGKNLPSQWLLRFQFSRSGVQVTPSQTNP